MNRLQRCAAVLAIAAVVAGGTAAEANAAASTTFGPKVITDIPAAPPKGQPAIQMVVPLATIDTPIQAGKTAYVYSTLRAYDADQVNLVDNEVRCSGAGASNVVMGENVMPPTGDPAYRNLTLVTRFLVTATSSGTLTCTLYLRTSSTSAKVARETVDGTLRFASTAVVGDVNGAALQRSLPAGNTTVTSSVTSPVLTGKIPAGQTKLAVIADVEYHRCSTSSKCTSKAGFALDVATSGGANCATAPVAQSERTLVQGVNHVAVELYTIVAINPGCTDFQAKVTTTHLAGDPGYLGGAAQGLSDATGANGSTPNHTSAMTHIFAVPS